MSDQFKAKPKREPSTFQTILLLLVSLSIVFGMIAAVYYRHDIFRWDDRLHKRLDVLQVYQADGRWYKAQAKNFDPVRIDVSSKGVVWFSSKAPFFGLVAYNSDDKALFYPTSSPVHDVTFVDETLWAVTNHEVLHFDGTTWTSYPEGVATIKSSSLVANQDGVWLIDDWGHLSHFDGTTWTISDLKESLPEAQWSRPFITFLPGPQLALTADGKLWLAYNRLWYWDGEQWTETSPPEESSDDIRIVGVTEAGLWVRKNSLWLWDGENWRAPMEVLGVETGFPTGQRVSSISPLGNLITTNEGIFIRTDSAWQQLPSPKGSFPHPKEIGMEPDGTIWGIFSPQRTPWDIFKVGLAQLLFFATLAVIARFLFALSTRSEAQAKGTDKKHEALVWHKMIRFFFGVLLPPLLLMIIIAGALLLLFWIWPEVPWWLLLGVGVLLLWLAPPIMRRLFARWQGKREQKSLTRELIERAGLSLWVVGSVAASILILEWGLSRNWPPQIIFFLLSVLIVQPLLFFFLGQIWLNNQALKQGDYDKALRLARKKWRVQAENTLQVLLNRAPILLLAGRHLQVEQQIQQALNKQREVPLESTRYSLLAQLGYAYLGQERYPEAIQAFSQALEGRAITNESYALNGLAEVYLRQGHNPQRALELLDMALENKPTPFLYWLLRTDNITAKIIANRAWALAQQHRHLEAERVLEEAFEKVVSNSKPRLAALHYRAAHVRKLRGNKAAALEHARTAQKLDPHGDAGRLAAQAFASLR